MSKNDEMWDKGQLGQDEQYVRVSKKVNEDVMDESLSLKPVSIRLQQSLIDDFKAIAKYNGIGYQTLMRQVLTRYIEKEKRATRLVESTSQYADAKSSATSGSADAPVGIIQNVQN